MTTRLAQVFAVAAAMAVLAGAAEAKTTPSIASGASTPATAQKLARAVFAPPAAGFATPAARVEAQGRPIRLTSAFDPARLATSMSASSAWTRAPAVVQAQASAPLRFAPIVASRLPAEVHAAPDWGAIDAAYRGGPISSYGADGRFGLGVKLAIW